VVFGSDQAGGTNDDVEDKVVCISLLPGSPFPRACSGGLHIARNQGKAYKPLEKHGISQSGFLGIPSLYGMWMGALGSLS
jgi:hypothetical protein